MKLKNVWLAIVAALLTFSSCLEDEAPIKVETIEIVGENITDGQPLQLAVNILPQNSSNKDVTWSVTPAAIATVSEAGLLTPLKNGSVVVKATANDGSGIFGEKTLIISGIINNIEVSSTGQLISAINNANPGDSIFVHGGTYTLTSRIMISRDGTETSPIYLFPFPGDVTRPKLDFSAQAESSSNQGIVVEADYWHIKGIDIFDAGDNGMQIRGGSYNIIEFCSFSECSDTGLQLDNGASNNLILNCDSFYNADSSNENADGFACKLNAGTGNKFVGCRAWQNLDDGWDGYLRGADNITTTYENCWSYKNGYLKNGMAGLGDGNGFKTGGSDDKLLKHNAIIKNCIAAGNLVKGFDHNSNRGDIKLYNCIANENGTNMGFGSTNQVALLVVKNSAVLGPVGNLNGAVKDITNNSWQNGIVCDENDFVSIDMTLLLSPRRQDGSLPDIDYLRLVMGSDLIDKGIDVGLPFNGSKPDLGAFEFE